MDGQSLFGGDAERNVAARGRLTESFDYFFMTRSLKTDELREERLKDPDAPERSLVCFHHLRLRSGSFDHTNFWQSLYGVK